MAERERTTIEARLDDDPELLAAGFLAAFGDMETALRRLGQLRSTYERAGRLSEEYAGHIDRIEAAIRSAAHGSQVHL